MPTPERRWLSVTNDKNRQTDQKGVKDLASSQIQCPLKLVTPFFEILINCAIINNGTIIFITTSLTGNYRDVKVHDSEDLNFGCSMPKYIIKVVKVFYVTGIVLVFWNFITKSFVSADQLEFHLSRILEN